LCPYLDTRLVVRSTLKEVWTSLSGRPWAKLEQSTKKIPNQINQYMVDPVRDFVQVNHHALKDVACEQTPF
ncbi:hypothetical protein, partial [Limosilactobacillus fermentum]|uniref:hypothetical protein n=1 Tax=Limosilactobacillus fermentum TaxID=1613 RepID=UPI001EE8C4AC